MTRASKLARKHWVFGSLLLAGLVLRVAAQIGYRPALLYIDSKKYLFGTEVRTWGAFDPLGYLLLILRPVLRFGNLAVVAVLQHVLGIALAVTLYLLLRRLGIAEWPAALATAPVLLDGYQLVAEQTIMPDTLFEVLLVAGLAVLLWRGGDHPGLAAIAVAALALGLSAIVRQVGEVLILPALLFVLAVTRGWRSKALHAGVLTVCFALPILGYMTWSEFGLHSDFELSDMGDEYLYGRTAHAADCATLTIPADYWSLCPKPAAAAALGVDGLVNLGLGPSQTYAGSGPALPPGANIGAVQRDFAYDVIKQQPLRVAGDIADDAIKLFALTRDGSPGDTPISRWQFQDGYPYYPPGITPGGATSANVIFMLNGGGTVQVDRPVAAALRDYQLNGGYTPGPVFLLCLVAGLAGIVSFRRLGEHRLALACLLIVSSGVAVLIGADVYEFSWRYQLPALVTLPAAGALGATALTRLYRRHHAALAGPPAPAPATAPAAELPTQEVV